MTERIAREVKCLVYNDSGKPLGERTAWLYADIAFLDVPKEKGYYICRVLPADFIPNEGA